MAQILEENKGQKSILHEDFGVILKKKYHISLFNLLVIVFSIFLASFFAGNQFASVFTFSPKAFFGTQQGGINLFAPSPTSPAGQNCNPTTDLPPPGCTCDYGNNGYTWHCATVPPSPTKAPTPTSATGQNCNPTTDFPPQPGCTCDYSNNGYKWNCPSAPPSPTKAPTPTSATGQNCNPTTDLPPQPGCTCEYGTNGYRWQNCNTVTPTLEVVSLPSSVPTTTAGSGGQGGTNVCSSVGQSCKDTYPCSPLGLGCTTTCHKVGTCTGVGSGVNCSWGAGSYWDPCGGGGGNPPPSLPVGGGSCNKDDVLGCHAGGKNCCSGYACVASSNRCEKSYTYAGGVACPWDCTTSSQACRNAGGTPHGSGGCSAGVCCE